MSTNDPTGTWTCEAYGPEVEAIGALCYFADPGERVCHSQAECAQQMTGARQRVYRRINELAAAGSPDMAFLAEEFTNPAQILGGAGADDDQPDENPKQA